MKKSTGIQLTTFALFSIALLSVLIKLYNGYFVEETFENGLSYKVSYEFEMKSNQNEPFFVKAFLPLENSRQKISHVSNVFREGNFEKINLSQNNVGLWNGDSDGLKSTINFNFQADVKPVKYTIDPNLELIDVINDQSAFVLPSAFIESNDPRIMKLGKQIKGSTENVDEILTAIFNYVYEVPSQPIKELMTAIEVLDKNAASCNGKSRLFVAICRSLQIPARVAGGIILNEERKKTSHLWAEVQLLDEWVPFDPLNGYFAYLPANYLEVYKGDEFLVKRSSDMHFDYYYNIEAIQEEGPLLAEFNLFNIAGKSGLSLNLLAVMILLPIGALIVAIFRNVIGMKTFGVFLPVLIAFSFESTGVIMGIISFVGVLMLISVLHKPLMAWGLLHVPKLVVMLSAVVMVMLIALFIGVRFNFSQASALTFFPIIILTIAAEKYARVVTEEGFVNASKILGQTIIVALFCYLVVSSNTIFLLLINFPELLLLVGISALMLGKWVGLRISEYKRFNWVMS